MIDLNTDRGLRLAEKLTAAFGDAGCGTSAAWAELFEKASPANGAMALVDLKSPHADKLCGEFLVTQPDWSTDPDENRRTLEAAVLPNGGEDSRVALIGCDYFPPMSPVEHLEKDVSPLTGATAMKVAVFGADYVEAVWIPVGIDDRDEAVDKARAINTAVALCTQVEVLRDLQHLGPTGFFTWIFPPGFRMERFVRGDFPLSAEEQRESRHADFFGMPKFVTTDRGAFLSAVKTFPDGAGEFYIETIRKRPDCHWFAMEGCREGMGLLSATPKAVDAWVANMEEVLPNFVESRQAYKPAEAERKRRKDRSKRRFDLN